MKRVILAGALLSMAMAGASFAPRASADQTSSSAQDIPFNTGFLNGCNGQVVFVAGVLHVTSNVTQTSNGNVNITQHLNYSDVKGTDALGNTYVVHNSDNGSIHENYYGQGVYTVTYPQSFAMVTTGAAPNFEVHVLFHITIAADGSFTAFVDSFTSTCP